VPIFNKFKDAWNVVAEAIDRNKEKFADFIQLLQTYVLPVLGTIFSKITEFAGNAVAFIIDVFGTIAGAVTPIVNFIIDNINRVIRGINLIKPGADIAYLNQMGAAASVNMGGYSGIPSGSGSGGTSSSAAGGSSGGTGGGVMSAADIAAHNAAIAKGTGGAMGATSLVDLGQKLQGISDKIAETTFLLVTDAISSKTAQTTLNALQSQFDVLSNQADALVAMQPGLPEITTNPLAGTYYGSTGRDAPTINVTVNGAVDSEGTARTIVRVLNDSYDRATGGATLLAGVG